MTPAMPRRRYTRREALALGGAGLLGAALAACGGSAEPDEPPAAPATSTPSPTVEPSPSLARPASVATATATPASTPHPPPPRGREERALMLNTEWENPLVGLHSGRPGPTLLVLGGVHGNEPGGWLAAESVAGWELPARGSLVVIPRANIAATRILERTTDELGDLNRLYPGSFSAELPMERMAAHIVEVARHYRAALVLDMHESWGFYVERGENSGTAFIGQTITSGTSPTRAPMASVLADMVNAGEEVERDLLVARDRSAYPAPYAEDEPRQSARFTWRPGRGRSSLSLGSYVPGLTPVLIEMGQQNQPVERRAELHQRVVGAALEVLAMV